MSSTKSKKKNNLKKFCEDEKNKFDIFTESNKIAKIFR